MATDQKQLIQRIDVRTMKKDIKRLREADVVKESQKIVGLGTTDTEKLQPEEALKNEALPQVTNREIDALDKTKQYANENEKQQIFLFQSQKKDIEAELQKVAEKKQQIGFEKSKIVAEQTYWQEKLNPILEQEKTATEDQKDPLEKQKWPIEQALAKLKTTIKNFDENNEKLSQEENGLTIKISEINHTLKEIYDTILKREVHKKTALQKEQQTVATETTPNLTPPKTLEDTEKTPDSQEKIYEKTSKNNDQEQKRKFMEDVEKWVNSSKEEQEN